MEFARRRRKKLLKKNRENSKNSEKKNKKSRKQSGKFKEKNPIFLGPPQAKKFGIWGSDKNPPHLRIPPLLIRVLN